MRRYLGTALLALLVAVSLPWTSRAWASGAAPGEHTAALYVFGTLVEVRLRGLSPERSARAIAGLEAQFRRMHRDWHAWQPGALVRLNDALARGEAVRVTPATAALIERAAVLSRSSGWLFNPAMGRLVGLWGFHSDEPPSGAPPPADAIARLVAAAPRMSDIDIDGSLVSARNPFVQLDFGAFAKGYALDQGRALLRRQGVRHALLNAGGDLCVMGEGPAGAWRVAVRDPFAPQRSFATLRLADGDCAMTSGNYARYRQGEGARWGHIIDPRTGYPVRRLVSVTVLDSDGARADAAATALAVAGAKWRATAGRMGISRALVVRDTGTIQATGAFRAAVQDLDSNRLSPGGDGTHLP